MESPLVSAIRRSLLPPQSNTEEGRRSADALGVTKRFSFFVAGILALAIVCLRFLHLPTTASESYFDFYSGFIVKQSQGWIVSVAAVIVLGKPLSSFVRRTHAAISEERLTCGNYHGTLTVGLRTGWKHITSVLGVLLPVCLDLVLLSYLVGYINIENKNRLVDVKLASVDRFLTGTYPFLTLGAMDLPVWLTKTIESSFLNLPLMLIVTGVLTFIKDKKSFSKYVVSFLTSIIIMMPLWLVVPAMSPQDRFIDNVYHLDTPARIESAVHRCAPAPAVETFLKMMRVSKKPLEAMPTSTFPSSHAAWAAITFLALLEVSPYATFIFSPFLLLSTFGTFYLSQHYFVDAPAGITVGVISIWLASLILRVRKKERLV